MWANQASRVRRSEPLRLSGFLLELEEGERQIDLLVNCAGIGTSGPFLAQDWMTEQDLIESPDVEFRFHSGVPA